MKRSIARLIEADAAIDAAIDGADAADGNGSLEREESIEEYVNRVPAADAIPISWLQAQVRSEYEPDAKAAVRVMRMWEKAKECI